MATQKEVSNELLKGWVLIFLTHNLQGRINNLITHKNTRAAEDKNTGQK